jgi:hypothetical protein
LTVNHRKSAPRRSGKSLSISLLPFAALHSAFDTIVPTVGMRHPKVRAILLLVTKRHIIAQWEKGRRKAASFWQILSISSVPSVASLFKILVVDFAALPLCASARNHVLLAFAFLRALRALLFKSFVFLYP